MIGLSGHPAQSRPCPCTRTAIALLPHRSHSRPRSSAPRRRRPPPTSAQPGSATPPGSCAWGSSSSRSCCNSRRRPVSTTKTTKEMTMPGTDPQPDAPGTSPVVVRTGRVLLEPADSDGRHDFACAFTAAGRVKRSDQQLSDWLIPASYPRPSRPPLRRSPFLPRPPRPLRLWLASGAQGLASHRRHLQPAMVPRGGDRPRIPQALRQGARLALGTSSAPSSTRSSATKLRAWPSHPSAYRLSSSTLPTSTKTQDSGSQTPSTTSNPWTSSTILARPAMSGRPSPPSDPSTFTRPPHLPQQEDPQCPKNSKPSRNEAPAQEAPAATPPGATARARSPGRVDHAP